MGFFFTFLLAVVFFVLSEVLKPKPNIENARPAGLDEFKFPTATEGRFVPIVWGTIKVEGPNVVWYGDLLAVAITEEIKTGMFSSETITKGYKYHIGIQFAICRGEIGAIRKVWVGEDLVFDGNLTSPGTINIDKPKLFGGNNLGNGGVVGDLDVLFGSTTQTANTYLSTFQQQGGDTPAYRGTCYLVWKQGYVGNSPSIKPWAFEVRRHPNPLGLSGANNALNSGNDLNPISALYELMTDTDYGLGIPTTEIDTANFNAAALTLASENNGMSFIINAPLEAREIVIEIERQIDGFVYTDPETGLWKVNLVREGDTSIGTIDDTNTLKIKDFGSSTWLDVVNQVRVQFSDRAKDYDATFALAQDSASFRVVGGNVIADQRYPGVFNAALANSLAWRDLRSLSRPLKKATIVVNREFYLAVPGQLIKFTSPQLGIVQLDMRVTRVDLGNITKGEITLSLVEDIFSTHAASFADPPQTNWTAPSHTMTDITSANKVIFEAPRAFMTRDPKNLGVSVRVWAGARNPGQAQIMDILGDGELEGTVTLFLLAAKVKTAVTRDQTSTIVLKSDPDSSTTVDAATQSRSNEDRGINLANLVLINNEFISIADATASGSDINLTTPQRGYCDTAPAEHAVDDICYLLYVGGGLTDGSFDTQASVDIKLIPESVLDRLADGSATAQTVTITDRHLKPYPPLKPTFNGSGTYPATSISIDNSVTGAGDDDIGISVGFTRRDYRNTNEYTAQLNEDSLPSDFPTANDTKYRVKVTDDPDGTPTVLFTTSYNSGGNTVPVARNDILLATDGVVPSRLRIDVQTQHTVDGTDIVATQDLQWDVDVNSADLDGSDQNWGVLDTNEVSSIWSAPSTDTYTFSIGSNVLSSGAVEARLNGGSWTTVISSGNTSGSLAITAADDVEVRCTQTGSDTIITLLKVNDPSSGDTVDAYAILRI